jgi:hypothetical protein
MKHIQKSKQPKSIGKFIPAYGFLKSQDKISANQKFPDRFPKENHTLG